MPLVVVDARGLTFRPSGARTRLVSLLSAYAALPERFDVCVVATAARGAPEHFRGCDLEVIEQQLTARRKAQAALRLVGHPFDFADLVHRETLPVPVLQRVPVLVTIHDLRSSEARSLASSVGKGFYERVVFPRAAQSLSRIIAVSQATAAQVELHLGVEEAVVAVIPNGVTGPGTNQATARTVDEPYVLAFGHMEPRKNLQTVLPAMQLAARSPHVPNVLVIAGRDLGGANPLRQAYAALRAPTFELIVIDDVDDAMRESLLQHAECLVAPSKIEGFGLVPLEALSRGTPAVVADIPATREAMGTAADFVDPDRPAAFAHAIEKVVDNPHRLLANAPGVLSHHSWVRSAELLHQVWTTSLDPSRRLGGTSP